jgi:hypothetical protein
MSKNRRPELKVVRPPPKSQSHHTTGRVVHDSRGNATWLGSDEPHTDTGTLALVHEPSSEPSFDGDPYNRPAGAMKLGPR